MKKFLCLLSVFVVTTVKVDTGNIVLPVKRIGNSRAAFFFQIL
mgnify:CR=1 FL=1